MINGWTDVNHIYKMPQIQCIFSKILEKSEGILALNEIVLLQGLDTKLNHYSIYSQRKIGLISA